MEVVKVNIVYTAAALFIGFMLEAVILLAIIRRKNDRSKKRRIEFSKLILFLVMIGYFVTVGVGIKLSFINPSLYSTLAMLVGAPTATALGFYAWKARAEKYRAMILM